NAAVEWLAKQGVNAGDVITRNPDQEAAAAVIAAIDAIGEVTEESAGAIKAAREAYDALTDAQKKLVSNYETLLAAEKALEELGVKPVEGSDVAENAWDYDAVYYVSGKGIMNGTGADTFSPNLDLSRAMLVTMLARIDGADVVGGDTWYEKGREWAMESGVSDGSAMESAITREQLVVMLYRYAQKLGLDTSARADLSGFDDAEDISSWALEAMQWAVSTGLIKGTSDTAISPQGTATRAQAATLIMRFMKYIVK
ncbi:MAG: S-layer homology domain-containing protein, partial [Oscillospiraceae bacterium]|nr:S-layer homology domain-containing protein [Oscillospiraceae bacterium]